MLYSQDYCRIWQNFGLDGALPVLECNPTPGMTAYTQKSPADALIFAWVLDPTDQENSEPFPVLFSNPHHLIDGCGEIEGLLPLALTMLADSCMLFSSGEELTADARVIDWPAYAFAAIGIYDENGNIAEKPSTTAFLTGKIILAVKTTNELTAINFWMLRVRTQHGELFVCLPSEAIREDPTGKFIAVGGRISGSFPDLLPERLTEDQQLQETESKFDNEEVENKIRELTLAFTQTPEFDLVFNEIHTSNLQIGLVKGIGLFNKDFRTAGKNLAATRQLATPQLRERYLHAIANAPIVFANIVMANTEAVENGRGSAALVVLSWGEKSMEVMGNARSTLARVHFDIPENEAEQELANLIEDEEYQFGRRRPLPHWLVGDNEAYAADLWITGAALDHERLRLEMIVCFAEENPNGLTFAIPGKLIQQALDMCSKTNGPPPLPSSASYAQPPPLPGS